MLGSIRGRVIPSLYPVRSGFETFWKFKIEEFD